MLRAERNMVYLGVPKSEIPAAASLPISWDTNTLTIKDETHSAAAMLFVFPEGERLAAAMVATVTFEYLLFGTNRSLPERSCPITSCGQPTTAASWRVWRARTGRFSQLQPLPIG